MKLELSTGFKSNGPPLPTMAVLTGCPLTIAEGTRLIWAEGAGAALTVNVSVASTSGAGPATLSAAAPEPIPLHAITPGVVVLTVNVQSLGKSPAMRTVAGVRLPLS